MAKSKNLEHFLRFLPSFRLSLVLLCTCDLADNRSKREEALLDLINIILQTISLFTD